jgi:hypothetical protein
MTSLAAIAPHRPMPLITTTGRSVWFLKICAETDLTRRPARSGGRHAPASLYGLNFNMELEEMVRILYEAIRVACSAFSFASPASARASIKTKSELVNWFLL